jgi:hypothetical protein
MNSQRSAGVAEQRAGPDFPQVGIDRSAGLTGKVYVAWSDTRFRSDGVNDPVFVSSDATTSQTWGPVTRINNGSTTDHNEHWNTMIGVSPDGTVRAAYRQRDESFTCLVGTCNTSSGEPYLSLIHTYYQSSSDQGATWSTPLKVNIPSTNDGYCAFSRGGCFLGDYNQLATGGPYTYIVREEAYASVAGEPPNNVGGVFNGCPTSTTGPNGFQCHTHQSTWVAVIGPIPGNGVAESPLIAGLALTGAAAAGLVVAVRRRRNKRTLSLE